MYDFNCQVLSVNIKIKIFGITSILSFLISEKALILARSVTERLVQRLICGAGMLDSRFSTKYLINDTSQQTVSFYQKVGIYTYNCFYMITSILKISKSCFFRFYPINFTI